MTNEKSTTLPLHPTIQNLRPSATLVINERSKAMVEAGQKVYRLGFGQSPFSVPNSVVNVLQNRAHEKDYLPVKGLPQLRTAVANFNQKKLSLNSSAEDVIDKIGTQVSNSDILLVLNYPNNPTGTSYTSDQLKSLADAFRRNNILVIADEIYSELHHAVPRVSLSKYYPEGTIISEGLSKWWDAGGWCLGTFTFPKDARATIASETFNS